VATIKGDRRARAKGDRAEDAVADYLIAHGFTILDRNARVGALEIDLVVKKDDLVVLVEVRTRGVGSFSTALASITPKKRVTIVRAAERIWRERFASDASVARLRIDVAAVSFEGRETHVEYIESAITG
jgi:putative endonuclease